MNHVIAIVAMVIAHDYRILGLSKEPQNIHCSEGEGDSNVEKSLDVLGEGIIE